jgi:hypothetical protein
MWVRHNEAIIAQNVNVALRKYLSREHAIASVATASDFPQITLSQVPRREALGFTRLLGAGALVDRVLRYFNSNRSACWAVAYLVSVASPTGALGATSLFNSPSDTPSSELSVIFVNAVRHKVAELMSNTSQQRLEILEHASR